MFLILWRSEPQRSYKHGSYKKSVVLLPTLTLPPFSENRENVEVDGYSRDSFNGNVVPDANGD